jgi:hypothetical protein
VLADGLEDFVWFDIDQGTSGLGHGNWALDGDPAALAAFREVAREYR